LLQYTRKDILEADEKSSKADLQSLEGKINVIDEEISNLNEASTKRITGWKDEAKSRCGRLFDFSGILDRSSVERLSNVKEYIDYFPVTITGLSSFSGKQKGSLGKKIGEWNKLRKNLEEIEEKLKPETIKSEFGIKDKTVDALKRLATGESIMISDLSLEEITDLKNSERLSKSIRVSYISKREADQEKESAHSREEWKRRMQRIRDAEVL